MIQFKGSAQCLGPKGNRNKMGSIPSNLRFSLANRNSPAGHHISYSIDPEIHRRLGDRDDDEVVPADAF